MRALPRFLFAALFAFLISASAVLAEEGHSLRWARVSDALTLDPHARNEGPTMALLHHVYETLLWRDKEGKLIPRLALSWRMLPEDAAVWEIRLRPHVKFHDGTEMNADDVVFSLNRARMETSAFNGLHRAVAMVEKAGDLTIRVKMTAPAPLWINNLTNTFIMSKKWAEVHNATKPQDFLNKEDTYAAHNENGTGPYTIVSREPEVRTALKLYPAHWAGQKPAVTEIVYTPIKSDATRIAALISGEVDFVQDVPAQDVERLKKTPGIRVSSGTENRAVFFSFDMGSDELRSSDVKGKNPFKDVRVRRAFDLALDRDAIHQVVMRGQSMPSHLIAPPFVNGWTKELSAYGKPDIAGAKKLLVEAGYEHGFSVNLNCTNDRFINDEAICQAYVGMLGQIGITARPVLQSRTLLFPMIEKAQVDFFMLGWGVPPYDSGYIFDYLVHSRPSGGNHEEEALGTTNGAQYSNPEVDRMIEALPAEIDVAKRNAMIAKIWAQVREDQIFIPLHNQVLTYAMKQGINIDVTPDNQPFMGNVTFGATQ